MAQNDAAPRPLPFLPSSLFLEHWNKWNKVPLLLYKSTTYFVPTKEFAWNKWNKLALFSGTNGHYPSFWGIKNRC
jgi:hypothetical protein